MRKSLIVALLAVLLSPAYAGERLLGTMLVSDGGSVNNATTGYGAAGCASQSSLGGAGSCPQAFRIGASMLLSVQCVSAAILKVNWYVADAGDGVKLAADQFFTTSTGSGAVVVPSLTLPDGGGRIVGGMPDGGSYVGGVVAIYPVDGVRAECRVFERHGGE